MPGDWTVAACVVSTGGRDGAGGAALTTNDVVVCNGGDGGGGLGGGDGDVGEPAPDIQDGMLAIGCESNEVATPAGSAALQWAHVSDAPGRRSDSTICTLLPQLGHTALGIFDPK
jgi:hypothetical protein